MQSEKEEIPSDFSYKHNFSPETGIKAKDLQRVNAPEKSKNSQA